MFITKLFCQNTSFNDEENIKKVLEKESATWRSGDIKAHASCWEKKPYSKIVVSTGDGNFIDIPIDMIINPNPQMLGKGGIAINSNYNFNIKQDIAIVSHNEESIAADGKKTFSFEIRFLEKINDSWKLVGQSIHIIKNK